MDQEEQFYAIALRAVPFIGDVHFMKLMGVAGSAKDTWRLSEKWLQKIPGIGPKISKSIGNEDLLRFAEKELQFCLKNKIQIKLRHLKELPRRLSECADAPAILYQKGNYDESLVPISMVGTRKITRYGKAFIEEFLGLLNGKKALVVSGLALGTDGCAHAEALKNNLPTVAILAHGLHTIYPSQHQNLAKKILENEGALLSEFNSGVPPERENFLQRNRIVAGFSPVTLVVETAFGGGSMSTVSFANDYNREVFALPGKINDPYSQGCHLIISQHKARIISDFNEIVEELGLLKTEKIGRLFEPKTFPDRATQTVYECIAEERQISLDELSEKLNIAPHQLLPILLDLELKSYIKTLSGKQYSLL